MEKQQMVKVAANAQSETLICLALDAIGRTRGNEEFEAYVETQLDYIEAWLQELKSRQT